MTINDKGRDDLKELSDVFVFLGGEYSHTVVECDPGDLAVKITKQGSENTLYIITYHDPDDIEMLTYNEPDSVSIQCCLYDKPVKDLDKEEFAAEIMECFW